MSNVTRILATIAMATLASSTLRTNHLKCCHWEDRADWTSSSCVFTTLSWLQLMTSWPTRNRRSLERDKRKRAIKKVLFKIEENNTRTQRKRPLDKEAIPCMMIFKHISDNHGLISCYKACLVVKGRVQKKSKHWFWPNICASGSFRCVTALSGKRCCYWLARISCWYQNRVLE